MIPRISVVMCVHNGSRYLRAAIDSVLNQSFGDFEFIIVDDASTDSTPDILAAYARRDDRIRLLRNEQNLTAPKSANRGLRAARGEFIARMDADDICMPDRFEKQVTHLENNPNIILVGGAAHHIDANGRRTGLYRGGAIPPVFAWNAFFFSPAMQPTVMFRTGVMRKHNLYYDQQFNRAADYELWLRMIGVGECCELTDILVQYRTHDKNISTQYADIQTEVARRARLQYTKQAFPNIPFAQIEALQEFIQPQTPNAKYDLAKAFACIRSMEKSYIDKNNFDRSSISAIRRSTARIVFWKIVAQGVRCAGAAANTLKFLSDYFPEYTHELITGVSRQIRRKLAWSRQHDNPSIRFDDLAK